MITLMELLDLSFQCCHFACKKHAHVSNSKEQHRRHKFNEYADDDDDDDAVEAGALPAKLQLARPPSRPPSYSSSTEEKRQAVPGSDTFI